jgi:hypothetical protein
MKIIAFNREIVEHMRNLPLVVIAGAVPLLLAAVAMWVWVTIPPEPDPDALPSRVLEPPSAAYRDAVEEGRFMARALVAEEKLPGLSLAVALNGEIVWAEGFRWADLENQTPVTPATLFRIGGVSKTLTAAAVGLLSERARLDLDAPVQRYVPSFPEKEWPISTRQLMAHTAGIRHHGEIFRESSCADDAERLAIFAGDPLRFRPGTEYFYSNYGWVLVGAVVAAAANEPYLGRRGRRGGKRALSRFHATRDSHAAGHGEHRSRHRRADRNRQCPLLLSPHDAQPTLRPARRADGGSVLHPAGRRFPVHSIGSRALWLRHDG